MAAHPPAHRAGLGHCESSPAGPPQPADRQTAPHRTASRVYETASARNREVGVATEIPLSKAEQVSDEGACAAGLRLK